MGYGTAISLALAAYFHNDFAGSVPLFLVFLIVGAVFFDGGFSNIGPYPAEIFRSSCRGVQSDLPSSQRCGQDRRPAVPA